MATSCMWAGRPLRRDNFSFPDQEPECITKEEGYRTREQKGRQTNNDERSRDHGRGRGWTEALGAGLVKERKTEEQREEQEDAISTDSVQKMRLFH